MTELMKSMSRRERIRQQMLQPVDSAILTFVRIVTGITIFLWACSYTKLVPYDSQWLPVYDPVFLKPRILFKYAGFEWVQLWPGTGIYWHFFVTKLAAVTMAVGLLTRLSAAILCASIAYVMLVERQIYLNHYYLLACAAGLLVFLPAGRRWSVDSVAGIEPTRAYIANWQLWLLRFQLGMPYVFGAIAKLDSDWFAGAPARILLESGSDLWLVDAYLNLPGAVMAFAIGGFLYDLLVVPMLLWHRTRLLAVLMSLVFHITNSQLFVIGVFPWFMLATIVVFLPPDTVPKFFRWISSKYTDDPLAYDEAVEQVMQEKVWWHRQAKDSKPSRGSRIGLAVAGVYVAVQLLLPIRPWVLPGNSGWNERGQRFAWRMMLRHKDTLATYLVVSPDGAFQFFPSTMVMTHHQASRAERHPELLRQGAVELKKMAVSVGVEDAKVYCLALVSLNGRRPVPLVDPTVDLAMVTRGWFSDPWVLANTEPLPDKPWNVDQEQWWQEVDLPDPFKPLQGRRPSELEALVRSQQAASNTK